MTFSLTQSLRRARQIKGGDIAIVDATGRVSWNELVSRVARVAGGLKELGLSPGDRVAILSRNSGKYVEAIYATLWAGGIVAPLNSRLSAREIAAQIADIEPTITLFEAEYGALLAAACDGATGGQHIWLDGTGGGEEYDGLLDGPPIEAEERAGDDVAILFFTGGTSGDPKAVMLSHLNVMSNSVNLASQIRMGIDTVHLHCGPFFHVAAASRVFAVTQAAGRHVILPQFEPLAVATAIRDERITIASFVPTMVRTLLDLPSFDGFDLSSLDYVTYGAAPMSEGLIRELAARLPRVKLVQAYGMTETSPVSTLLGPEDHAVAGRLRSAGRAVPLAEIRIVAPDGSEMPGGQAGEIVVRGPMVMRGYWRRPRETAEATAGGWMHTGDVGFIDADGYLFVVDRLKDMIITGGENVYSLEVENVLSTLPAVLACAVIGVPHDRWGEAIHAVVVPRPGHALDPETVTEWCQARLARYKCPKSVAIRTTPLPLTSAGKIFKAALRNEYGNGSEETAISK